MKPLSVFGCSVLAGILAVILGFHFYHNSIEYPVAQDVFWGDGTQDKHVDVSIDQMEPIHFGDKLLDDLKLRLTNTRFFETLQGTHWQYGVNMEDLQKIVNYWRHDFDWRKQEAILNTYNHFIAIIDGLKVHYVHVKPATKTKKVLPIMLIHGWPGSFYEFYKLIPLLTHAHETISFEVICPSLPGYTFSEAPRKPGMDTFHIAKIFTKLMEALEFKFYYVQGGDWGSLVARTMAIFDPSHVRGIHLNLLVPVLPYGPLSLLSAQLFPSWYAGSDKEIDNFTPSKLFYKYIHESGYYHLQATKPDIIGVALNDSPVGLAAYIIAQFFTWSGCKENDSLSCVEACFTKDELLTNVMLYWFTASMPSALRLYKENKMKRSSSYPVSVPTSLAQFPHEFVHFPKTWLEIPYPNIVQYTHIARGGHFGAFQEPQLLADDIWTFVAKVEQTI